MLLILRRKLLVCCIWDNRQVFANCENKINKFKEKKNYAPSLFLSLSNYMSLSRVKAKKLLVRLPERLPDPGDKTCPTSGQCFTPFHV
jgi:hypothetical protein